MEIDFFGESPRGGSKKLEMCKKVNRLNFMTKDYMKFGFDYWDNSNIPVGGQGYRYDERYFDTAKKIIEHYKLKPNSKILEIGCSKGFLLVEFHRLNMDVTGCDLSEYAVANAHEAIKNKILLQPVHELVFPDNYFDLVLGKEILPHIPGELLDASMKNIMRIGKENFFFEIQCGESKTELQHMKEWDATHKIIETPLWWRNYFKNIGYKGDYHFKILVPDSEE